MKKITIIFLALLAAGQIFGQRFDVDTISMTGSIDDRINLVFLSDGYTEDELDKFIEDVHWMEDALLGKPPYKEYRSYFNSFAIKVPSDTSGAADDPSNLIDNYFGSSFNTSGIWRLVVPHRSSRAQAVLRDNFPQYDQVIMVVNESRYGGSGGWMATSTTHANGPEICIHEIGHSFAKLADEYWAGPQYAREKINMTQETDREKVKWKNWLDYRSTGIYSHSEEPSWKRPHQNCEMRYLNRQFCPVCQEAITDKILDLTSPIIEFSPPEDGFTHSEPEIEFSLNLLEPSPNTLNIRWTLNRDSITAHTDTLRFSSTKLLPGENIVVAFILDTTKYIRQSSHSRSHQHKVIWNFNSGTSGIEIREINKERFDLDVFPNPAADFVQLSGFLSNDSRVGINLVDPLGKIIKVKDDQAVPAGEFANRINLDQLNLASGLYHIRISIDEELLLLPLIIRNN